MAAAWRQPEVKMNGRDLVLTALDHREPERLPRDLGGTESSGVTAYTLHQLCSHRGIEVVPAVFEPFQYTAYVPDALVEAFTIDTINLTPEPAAWTQRANPAGFDVLLPENWTEETDAEGNTVAKNLVGKTVAKRPAGGLYFDPVNPPLADITSADELERHRKSIQGFDWPFFVDESIDTMVARARELRASDRCVVFNLCCHVLAAGQLLRGFENFMMDLLADQGRVERLLDILLSGYSERIERLAPHLKSLADVVLINDDLGTQNGPMLSVDLYRKMIKPRHRELVSLIKNNFELPVLFHSCGAVADFVPDLIDIGLDALNPVQVSAAGMDLENLKKSYGSEITFWGGGMDTQTVLNRATPDQVRDEVRRTVDIMAPGGGFVFCQVHNIQPDVPSENIEAMYGALDEIS
jgi:uroporphyrinogen decarboxylase